MIDLYMDTTANGYRAAILLEESGLPYRAHRVDHHAGETLTPDFIALSPLSKVPVIVDHDGPGGAPLTLAQSGAIALYVAQKSGRLLPADEAARFAALQWFFHVMTDHVGTNTALVFLPRLAEKPVAAIADFEARLTTYFGRVDRRLAEVEYLAGQVSIADLALYPIIVRRPHLLAPPGLDNLKRWRDRMATRPGVIGGLKVLAPEPGS